MLVEGDQIPAGVEKKKDEIEEKRSRFFDSVCHEYLNNTFHSNFYLKEIALVDRLLSVLKGLLDFNFEMRSFY